MTGTPSRDTILIVDDDVEIVDLLKDHFKKRGCEVISTLDSQAVVETLQNFNVRLMLLDLKMRVMDGFDVLDRVRKQKIALPPTIVITGFLPKYQDQLKRYGIAREDVLCKPFNFDELERFIVRKLGREILVSEVGTEYEAEIYKRNRCHIGIVEDEADVLRCLAEFFFERNYKVSCFRNAGEALDYLTKGRVDIMIIDIKLPGMSGDELAEKIVQMGDPPALIPISAAFTPPDLLRKMESLGCEKFLSKPFDVAEVIEYVKTIAVRKKLLG
ncbi:MAG: response regulator [Candidatus Omnitrophota bacterium]